MAATNPRRETELANLFTSGRSEVRLRGFRNRRLSLGGRRLAACCRYADICPPVADEDERERGAREAEGEDRSVQEHAPVPVTRDVVERIRVPARARAARQRVGEPGVREPYRGRPDRESVPGGLE